MNALSRSTPSAFQGSARTSLPIGRPPEAPADAVTRDVPAGPSSLPQPAATPGLLATLMSRLTSSVAKLSRWVFGEPPAPPRDATRTRAVSLPVAPCGPMEPAPTRRAKPSSSGTRQANRKPHPARSERARHGIPRLHPGKPEIAKPAPAEVQKPAPGGVKTPAPPPASPAAPDRRPTVAGPGTVASPSTGQDLLFRMMPTGTATVMGFVTVKVQRAANRIRIQAGSLADVVIQKSGNRYAFIENGAAPVEIQDVKTRRTATGTHFDVVLASGKRVGMEISADRRSLRAMGHELHFET